MSVYKLEGVFVKGSCLVAGIYNVKTREVSQFFFPFVVFLCINLNCQCFCNNLIFFFFFPCSLQKPCRRAKVPQEGMLLIWHTLLRGEPGWGKLNQMSSLKMNRN